MKWTSSMDRSADMSQTLTAAVQSVEDHGYIVDLGIPNVSGFLSFKDAPSPSSDDEDAKLPVGSLVNATVLKLSKNGRTCNVTADPAKFTSSFVRQCNISGYHHILTPHPSGH